MNATSAQADTWLAVLPSRWQLLRLKYLSSCNDEVLREDTPKALEIEYVDISSVSSAGKIGDKEKMLFGNAPSRARRVVQHGDVLVSTVRTYLKAIAPVTNPPANLIASTGFAVIRCGPDAVSGYLANALRADGFIGEVISRSVGISYPAINSADLVNITLPVPPLEEQTQIAKFLDYETAKIDALIEKQQQLIALLKEKRQAVISHTVTKGLNPDAPMRDSGVEWLGDVPAHWEVKRIKHITHDSTSGPYGSSLTKAMYSLAGIRVYGQQQVIANDFALGDYYISEELFSGMRRYEVFPEDILVTVMGTIGCVAVVPGRVERGIINPRLVRYKAIKELVLPRFLRLSLLGDIAQKRLRFLAQGSTMEGLNMKILGSLHVPLPEKEEQVAILRAVERGTKRLDLLVESAQQVTELLQERRTALISAAVTGKIDVRGWKPPTSETKAEAP